jgi:hypothetical protein
MRRANRKRKGRSSSPWLVVVCRFTRDLRFPCLGQGALNVFVAPILEQLGELEKEGNEVWTVIRRRSFHAWPS